MRAYRLSLLVLSFFVWFIAGFARADEWRLAVDLSEATVTASRTPEIRAAWATRLAGVESATDASNLIAQLTDAAGTVYASQDAWDTSGSDAIGIFDLNTSTLTNFFHEYEEDGIAYFTLTVWDTSLWRRIIRDRVALRNAPVPPSGPAPADPPPLYLTPFVLLPSNEFQSGWTLFSSDLGQTTYAAPPSGASVTEIADLPTAELVASKVLKPDGAGGVVWGNDATGGAQEITGQHSAELNTAKVLKPDGAGGVAWGNDATGGPQEITGQHAAELNTAKVLKPDGAGGVVWGTDADTIVTEIANLPAAEIDTAKVLKPNGAGGVTWGTDAGGTVAEIADLPTAELVASKVLKPDGAGGVTWGTDADTIVTEIANLPAAEIDTAKVLKPNGAGGVTWGTDAGGTVAEIADLPTAETDTGKVLKPDGAGGVAWVTGSGATLAGDLTGDINLAGYKLIFNTPGGSDLGFRKGDVSGYPFHEVMGYGNSLLLDFWNVAGTPGSATVPSEGQALVYLSDYARFAPRRIPDFRWYDSTIGYDINSLVHYNGHLYAMTNQAPMYGYAPDTYPEYWQRIDVSGGGVGAGSVYEVIGLDGGDYDAGSNVTIRAGSIFSGFNYSAPGTVLIQGGTNAGMSLAEKRHGDIEITTVGADHAGGPGMSGNGGDITIRTGIGGSMGGTNGALRCIAGYQRGANDGYLARFVFGSPDEYVSHGGMGSDGYTMRVGVGGAQLEFGMGNMGSGDGWMRIVRGYGDTILTFTNNTILIDGNEVYTGTPGAGQTPIFHKGFCIGVTP